MVSYLVTFFIPPLTVAVSRTFMHMLITVILTVQSNPLKNGTATIYWAAYLLKELHRLSTLLCTGACVVRDCSCLNYCLS